MTQTNGQEAIAIIGMAGRFPKARNLAEFWRILRDGVDAITFFKEDELEESSFGRTHGAHCVKARGLLEDADKFDAEFFGINPKEAELIDPQHRVFLETAWEALEEAGYDTQREERPIGVFAGMSMNTYMLSNLISNPELVELVGGYHMMLANDKDFLPMRVSYKLNLRGPSMNVQTACSTSLVAVCLACEQLLSYQCDMALAGGVSITFPQRKGHIFQEGGIASQDGHCRAFDARAAGTVAGEGAGVVVLKRLSDAVADGDDIHAVIKGFALNNDGSLKAGYTAPSEDGQAECIALAQALAGVEPETIEYVMTHGTGTPLGDPIEIAGLTKAFRAGTQAKSFCALTSVKTNIGHLDTAAGIAGLIAAVLALKHKEIPPSLYFEEPNPKIDFENSPFYVNTRLRDWKRAQFPRRAGVSSFGIGGTNSHVVLEEAPERAVDADDSAPQLLVLSARTPTALNNARSQLAGHLRENTAVGLPDIAFTLQTGRREFNQRCCVVAHTLEEAAQILSGANPQRLITGEAREGNASIAFMFPGQGSQQINMGRELYRQWEFFRHAIDECDELLRPHLNEDIRELMYVDGKEEAEAAGLKLQETRITQPALFVTSYAMAQLWMHLGMRPEAMIGHSIGEYVAACLAGVMSLPDALRIVSVRGRLMQQMKPGSMLAVRASEEDLGPVLGQGVSIAAINGPMQCVLSGTAAAIEQMERALGERKIACQRLRTSHAFHSQMMEPMLREFAESVRRAKLRAPGIPFISNVSGTWISPKEAADPEYWVQHVRRSVRFAPGVAELLREGNRVFLECGPGQTLTGLVRQQAGPERAVVPSLGRSTGTAEERRAQLEAAGQLWLNGAALKWEALHETARKRVHLPTYPFERKRYWVEPGKTSSRQSERAHAELVESNGEVAMPANSRRAFEPASTMQQLQGLFAKLSGIKPDQMSPDATFIEMGLESLFLTHASQAIEKTFGVQVPFGQLVEKYSTLNRLAAHLDSVTASSPKEPSATARESQGADTRRQTTPSVVPLTEAQREIWFETQRSETASCVFNETSCIELNGPLDRAALERALKEIVARHEALRATVLPDGSAQTISPVGEVLITHTNLSGLNPTEREKALEELLGREGSTAFDLVKGPLIRFCLVALEKERHALIFTGHHLVCDGGSISLIVQEIGEFYNAYCAGKTFEVELPCAFSQFAEKDELQSGERAQAEKYWLNEFASAAPELELPADSPRPTSQTFKAGQTTWRIDRDLTRQLKRLSGQQGATLFTTLLAAYYVLLHRLSGQEDLVVGVPASGRNKNGGGRLVGHCVNFLPIRMQTKSDLAFAGHLKGVTRKFVEAHEHQCYTFGTLVQQLSLARTPNRMPLISATFNLQKENDQVQLEGLKANVRTNYRVFTNVDLTFDVVDVNDELTIECTYCADLFQPQTIQRWLGHYETLLQSVLAEPNEKLSRLRLLTPAEWQEIVVEWNKTSLPFAREACLQELFEAQVERTPDAVAVIVGRQEITYGELNRRANQVARYLRSLGAGPETRVGLCVERSFALLVGALGILKSAAAYVPVDWTYPAERVRFMLEDTGAGILLTQRDLLQHVPATTARVVCLDADWERIAEHDTSNPTKTGHSRNLACVMYTSGSTGVPKGVGLEHRNAVSFIHWARDVFPDEELAGVLASTPACFDLSIFELFVPLSWGGTVILADNAVDIPALPAGRKISLINTVPSAIKDLLKAGTIPSSVITVNLAGEKLSTQVVQQLYSQPNIRKVYDLYGPSEATTYATYALRAADGAATIGRPVANTQIYILDPEMQPCPIGVPGEIYIGGDCLARGYLNGPELTAQKFVPNPLSKIPDARLYKTGDIARYLPDGNIQFIGRRDHQIKIRGYRIELGEIETALGQHAGVHDCIVVARGDAEQKELVAYIVAQPDAQLNAAELRRSLRERLPDYMVPTTFITLPALPLTPNGKVDRAALPDPDATAIVPDEEPKIESFSTVEEAVMEIWRDVLGVEKIGLHDDFFDLGGHSVLVTQIMSRVRQMFEVELGLRHLFGAPTIASLARVIEQMLEEQLQQMNEQEIHQLASEQKGATL